jgi:uncharacterized protein YbaP (TraB family)
MNYFGRSIFIACAMLVMSTAHADAPVWRVSKGDRELLIGGTIHVLQEQDYPLPVEFERAYAEADKLVFEVDIAQASSPEFQQKLMQAALYDDGSTLVSHLRPSTLWQLTAFTKSRGIELDSLLSFKVGMLVVILTVNELNLHGIQGEGVDQYYSLRALEGQKPVSALETVEQQIEFLSRMGEGEEDQLVLQTIEELEDFGAEFFALKSAWRQGDTRALAEIGLEDFQAFPGAYQSILVNRNRAWLPKIETMLEDSPVEYVLVGVLHLVGEDSVLAMLEARGYQVERY